jgi:hypothetical protein
MDGYAILVAGALGGIVGGALGARLARAPAWKGAVAAAIASAIQFAVGEIADIRQPLVYSLVFLVAVGLVGGRWGLRLTTRQLAQVVIGSFLVALLAGLVVLYIGVASDRA